MELLHVHFTWQRIVSRHWFQISNRDLRYDIVPLTRPRALLAKPLSLLYIHIYIYCPGLFASYLYFWTAYSPRSDPIESEWLECVPKQRVDYANTQIFHASPFVAHSRAMLARLRARWCGSLLAAITRGTVYNKEGMITIMSNTCPQSIIKPRDQARNEALNHRAGTRFVRIRLLLT